MNSKHTEIIIALVVLAAIATLGGWYFFFQQKSGGPEAISVQSSSPSTALTASSTLPIQGATSGTQIYRNEEWGFEFEYPKNWSFHENTFYSPFSKFNLAGAPSGVEYQLVIPLLINIVTPDFANRVVMSSRNSGDIETDFVVGKLQGKKFDSMVPAPNIAIDLPFGEFRMILAAYKEYEDVFNQILATFKFIEPSKSPLNNK